MKISIVIPVYNEENYLPDCLESIARQTIQPYEVIVVDNNSTDMTRQVAARYPFVKIAKEKRQGTVFARNKGFDIARGEIIARIDADTRLPSDWTARIGHYFESHPDVAAVTGRPKFYDIFYPSFFDRVYVVLYQFFQRWLTGSYMLWGANMAIRKEAWRLVRQNCSRQTNIDEDIDLTLCINKKGLRISYLPDLITEASFQRGQLEINYTVKYLASWPRDYLKHNMFAQAVVVSALICLILWAALPFLLISKVALVAFRLLDWKYILRRRWA